MFESPLAAHPEPRDSLAAKIIFFVFASTLTTALVVSWIAIHSTYRFLRAALDQSYPATLERCEKRIEQWIAHELRHLEALVGRGEVARALAGEATEARALERLLAHETGLGRPFAAIGVLDARGALRLRVGTSSLEARAPIRMGAWVAEGRVWAAMPVHGSTAGWLLGVFSPPAIRDQLSSDLVGAGVYLVDAEGTPVAEPKAPSDTRFARFPADLLAAGTPGAREFRAADGRRGVAGVRPLRSLRGWLVVAQPAASAFAPVFSAVSRVFLVDLAIVLAVSFLAYEITSTIVRPLEALAEGARRISRGELDVAVPEAARHDEIGLLTRTFNAMAHRLRANRDEIDAQHRAVREHNDELQRANEVLEQLSITDGLTKLHNHRYFQEVLTREIKRASRTAEPLSMLLVDIDDFKQLNDRHGHAEGDALLARIAQLLNESVRESDVLARYGGEEFVVLATGTELGGALHLAEKIRTAVAEAPIPLGESPAVARVTVSIGVAQYRESRQRFFREADRALYRAKAEGKNCVVAAEGEAPEP